MVSIENDQVYNFTELNPRTEDAVNPNSAILCYFQFGSYTYERSAICTILFSLLNEPCFEQLRNSEQLGYVVQCGFSSQQKVLGGQILVQSSNHCPDFLEARINAFLRSVDIGGLFSEEKVEQMKQTQIQQLKLVAQNLATETSENWIYIMGDYIDTKSNRVTNMTDKLIQSYETVTHTQVIECFKDIFINNQRRINVKLQSQNHLCQDASDPESEGLGGDEFKMEQELAKRENDEHYAGLNMNQNTIENIQLFQLM